MCDLLIDELDSFESRALATVSVGIEDRIVEVDNDGVIGNCHAGMFSATNLTARFLSLLDAGCASWEREALVFGVGVHFGSDECRAEHGPND